MSSHLRRGKSYNGEGRERQVWKKRLIVVGHFTITSQICTPEFTHITTPDIIPRGIRKLNGSYGTRQQGMARRAIRVPGTRIADMVHGRNEATG